ncbi:MAG: malonate decarboxylase subunit alpha [Neisseriaceae bacterium]|nr:malonate decarboxylase subunit alpha [Neisseriaceae bacterium]
MSALKQWDLQRQRKAAKLARVASLRQGLFVDTDDIVTVMERLVAPYDRVVLEGNNQKQASFLSQRLAAVNPANVFGLHMIMSSVSRPEHLTLFELGIAERLDFSYAGGQSVRIAQMIEDGVLTLGDIHTYLELYGRLFIDLIPHVVLVAADQADRDGNLYTGFNTEETPTLIEAAAFKNGIVIVQVNEVVDVLPRVDIPASWVDVIVVADQPYQLEPLFTRDPKNITDIQVLMGMMAIKGIYAEHQVQSLNHGIGFNTAAIELLLPTYGERLGLKGKIAQYWALNPHPTMIPAIEEGWVQNIHCFGAEVGMEAYIRARPDVFFTGQDGSLRSNRTLCQVAGQYAVDLFIGSSLQIDAAGHSSTVTKGRLTGFGGAPNMGHNPGGRRHATAAWLDLAKASGADRGRKLVVQMVETFDAQKQPVIVAALEAEAVKVQAGLACTPVMIYGEDTTHLLTEEGIAYLYKTTGEAERRLAIAAVAGVTPTGLGIAEAEVQSLRQRGIVAFPEDVGVARAEANRSLLAARNMADLVAYSGGLYQPPAQFRQGG